MRHLRNYCCAVCSYSNIPSTNWEVRSNRYLKPALGAIEERQCGKPKVCSCFVGCHLDNIYTYCCIPQYIDEFFASLFLPPVARHSKYKSTTANSYLLPELLCSGLHAACVLSYQRYTAVFLFLIHLSPDYGGRHNRLGH